MMRVRFTYWLVRGDLESRDWMLPQLQKDLQRQAFVLSATLCLVGVYLTGYFKPGRKNCIPCYSYI